jgi:hypothetical protein
LILCWLLNHASKNTRADDWLSAGEHMSQPKINVRSATKKISCNPVAPDKS